MMKGRVKKYCVFLILVFIGSSTAFGQKESAIWYFGRHAGLDFREHFPLPLTSGKTNTREGVASVSDSLGKLLFYTDGRTIWSSYHTVLATGLAGDSASTHSATILPSRSDPKKYFVFTTKSIINPEDDNYGGKYYIVDFNDNPFGLVTEGTGDPGILRNSTEKFAAVPYMKAVEDGPGIPSYRLLMHEYDNDTFAHFNFDEVVSDYRSQKIGSWHLDSVNDDGDHGGASGQMKFSMQGDRVALAIEGERRFEVYDYDKETGELSDTIILMAGDREHGKTKFARMAYGVEFSPNGRFLYGTSKDGGYIYQWDLSITAVAQMRATIHFVRSNPEQNCGALQLAPNGKIYVAMDGADYLGVINSPNNPGERCEFEEFGVRLLDNNTDKGGICELGLPAPVPTGVQPEEFYYNHTCIGEVTSFYINNMTGLRSAIFEIRDSVTNLFVANVTGRYDNDVMGTVWEYMFPGPGVYSVKLQALYQGSNTIIESTRQITIHEPPPKTWPQDTVICTDEQLILDAGNGAFYDWVEADARERYLVVDYLGVNSSTGQEYPFKEFRVAVTHYNGCVQWDTITVVRKKRPELDYESTEAKCNEPNGTATVLPNGPIENYIYSWDGFPDEKSNTLSNIAGGTYGVFVETIETGCESYIEIPVNSQGAVRIIPSVDSLVCPGTEITLTAENADFFDWIIPESGNDAAEVIVKPMVTTTYRVRGTSNGPDGLCVTEAEYTVEVAPINNPDLGEDMVACSGDTLWLEGPDDYLVYNWNNGMSGRSIMLTQGVDPLVLYVKDTNQCIFSGEIAVTFHEQPDIKTTSEKALCGKLDGSASVVPEGNPDDYIFEWTDFPGNKSNKIFDVGAGLYEVKVTSILTGCDTIVEIAISEFGAPDIEIVASFDEAICPGTEIILTAKNADYYIWDDPDFTRDDSLMVAPYAETTYTVMGAVKDEEGNECKSYAEITIPVLPYDKPDIGPDLEACEGDVLSLDGEEKYLDWTWSNNMTGRLIDITQSEPELVLTAIDQNQCRVTDTVKISFHPYPDVYLGEDQTLCTNEPVILEGGTGASYLWSTNETTPQISVTQKGTFWLEIETLGCASRDSIILQLVNPDSIKIDSLVVRDISCYGEADGEIKIYAQGSGDTYTYSIDGGINYLDNLGHFENLPASDSYAISVLEDSVCSKNYPSLVSIVEPTEILTKYRFTSPSCDACMDGEINLTLVEGGSPPFSFLWDDMSIEDKRLDIGTGNYSVKIIDSRACYTELFFELDLTYRIPNAFTPNNDGVNDLWTIGIIEYHPDAIVKVFDNKGMLVFESAQGYPEPWDGKYQDEFLPMGTYYYLIYLNEEDKPEKGTVTIVR